MKQTISLPTSAEVMAFTREQIEKLPSYTKVDQLPVGSFAKKGWLKAPSSLVYILRNEVIEGSGNAFSYVNCNIYNGVVSDQYYACSAYQREWPDGGKYFQLQGNNLYSMNS